MLDLVIRRVDVVTASEHFTCDMGVRGHRIVSLGENLPEAGAEIDAEGLLTLPGGVDGHCRSDQPMPGGMRMADDFFPDITLQRLVTWTQAADHTAFVRPP